jgi:hypothetical protein
MRITTARTSGFSPLEIAEEVLDVEDEAVQLDDRHPGPEAHAALGPAQAARHHDDEQQHHGRP